jgi:uncharacterized protein (DUF433 family)
MHELSAYITINPAIRFGKPCITGTRITVSDILGWLSSGMTTREVLDDYPELEEIHIRSALAFAANRDTITKVIVHEIPAGSVGEGSSLEAVT